MKRNRVRCGICKDVIESKHRRDWVQCKGVHIYIDGGLECPRGGTLSADIGLEVIEDVNDDE